MSEVVTGCKMHFILVLVLSRCSDIRRLTLGLNARNEPLIVNPGYSLSPA